MSFLFCLFFLFTRYPHTNYYFCFYCCFRSLNIPRATEESLSRHSILGPNGLRGQWQAPSINVAVSRSYLPLNVFFFSFIFWFCNYRAHTLICTPGSLSKQYRFDTCGNPKVRSLQRKNLHFIIVFVPLNLKVAKWVIRACQVTFKTD